MSTDEVLRDARKKSFAISVQSEGAELLRKLVQANLAKFIGSDKEDVLAEYVVVLVGHGKHHGQVVEDLETFLNEETIPFADWLWEHLAANGHLYGAKLVSTKPEVVEKVSKGVVSTDQDEGRSKHSDKVDGDKPRRSGKREKQREERSNLGESGSIARQGRDSPEVKERRELLERDERQVAAESAGRGRPAERISSQRERNERRGGGESKGRRHSRRALDDRMKYDMEVQEEKIPEETDQGKRIRLEDRMDEDGEERDDDRQKSSSQGRPRVNPVARLLQTAVRDAVTSSRPLKKLRSVVAPSDEDRYDPTAEDTAMEVEVEDRKAESAGDLRVVVNEKKQRMPVESSMSLQEDFARLQGVLAKSKKKPLDRGPSFGSWLGRKSAENFQVEVKIVEEEEDEEGRGGFKAERTVKSGAFAAVENENTEREISIELEDDQGEEWLKKSPELAMGGKAIVGLGKVGGSEEVPRVSVWDRLSGVKRNGGLNQDRFVFGVREEEREAIESQRRSRLDTLDNAMVEEMKRRIREMQLEMFKMKAGAKGIQTGFPGYRPPVEPIPTPEESDARSIFVNNVHFAATSEALTTHFSPCGEILRATVLTDPTTGKPRGCAYVEFSEESSVEKALAMDGASFLSRQLKVVRKGAAKEILPSLVRRPSRGGRFPGRFPGRSFPARPPHNLQWVRPDSESGASKTAAEGESNGEADKAAMPRKAPGFRGSFTWVAPGLEGGSGSGGSSGGNLSYVRKAEGETPSTGK